MLRALRLNPVRRNPAKVPLQLMSRAALDSVGAAYESGRLPPESNPDASVLWDMMHDAGCEVLEPSPGRGSINAESLLHRWIVLDAVESAESVPQNSIGKQATAATRAWIANTGEITKEVVAVFVDAAVTTAAPSAYAAAAVVAHSAPLAAADASWSATNGGYGQAARNAMAQARLRFRVLATLDRAGILPDLPVQRR